LRHLLLRSGYRLCDGADSEALLGLPLPAAHYRLGPMLLRDALLTLAGSPWRLQVDEPQRQVCFARADSEPSEAPLSGNGRHE
jgi:type IV pili sensor histidine kinase/response regulator